MRKILKLIAIIMEAAMIIAVAFAIVAFVNVIRSEAAESPDGEIIAVIYQDAEQKQAHAIEIQEAPPINDVSIDLDEVDANGNQMEYIGEFRITYYCPCRLCNGSNAGIDCHGNPLVWGTVAVDPAVIPLGTHLVIDGYDAVFTARDTGGDWVRGKHIDMFVPVSHKEALAMAHGEKKKVWIWKESSK